MVMFFFSLFVFVAVVSARLKAEWLHKKQTKTKNNVNKPSPSHSTSALNLAPGHEHQSTSLLPLYLPLSPIYISPILKQT